MQFNFAIEVDENTTEGDPKREKVKLSIGILTKVSVLLPWGCAGLVGVRILHYEHQLYPTNPDAWFIGNDVFIEFEDEYLILEGPGEFIIEAYNLDDFYSHSPIVGFNVLRSGLGGATTQGWVGA